MGDRLPEDAYTYRYEDPILSMESRYWDFVVENFILSANEIYSHCITTLNLVHIREMIAVTQNLAYDFSNLDEFSVLRRTGVNAPFPRRRAFYLRPEYHEEEPIPQPKSKLRQTNDVRKKKGTNVRAPPFIPSSTSELLYQDTHPSLSSANDEVTHRLSTQSGQQALAETTWTPMVQQMPQISLPHYHIPFMNLVHYPIGNIYAHQISQNYPTYSEAQLNEKLTQDCKQAPEPSRDVSKIISERLVTHTGVQVELSLEESEYSPVDVELTREEISVNKFLGSPCAGEEVCEEEILPTRISLENVEVAVSDSDNVQNSDLGTTNKEAFCEELQGEKETKQAVKTSYKEVLMKGISQLPEVLVEDEKVDLIAECSSDKIESDEWTEVIRRKSNSSDIKLNRQKVNHDASRVNGWAKAGHHSNRRRQNQIHEVCVKSLTNCNKTAGRHLAKNLQKTPTKRHNVGFGEMQKSSDKSCDNLQIIKDSKIVSDKTKKTSDNIPSSTKHSDMKTPAVIDNFETHLSIDFDENLPPIVLKQKEKHFRKIKKRRNLHDLNVVDAQIADVSSNLPNSPADVSNLNSEMQSIVKAAAESSLYVSCDQNIDDDDVEYENAMLQLLSPTNASFYDFLSSMTPEASSDTKENYRRLFNDFKEYFNSLPVIAQKEEMDILRKIFFENVEVACNFRISTIEEFELLFAENPIAASQLENHIGNKLRQIRDSETKQQLAYEKRLQLLQFKTARVREQVQKVEEAKAAKYKLALQRKSQIDLKLKKAEENRKMYLSIIRKKAHDEEEKLKEIAFINELEAQNRRHDSLALRQEHEGRLQILIEERQRRLEEKAAKEAAVEERRRVLEAERQEKLEKLKEKRRQKEEIIDRKQQEREKERLVIAREKAREREERLQARKEAQIATMEELQKRIQQKQQESARRHEENIELIRQKALEIGLHRSILDDPNCHEDTEVICNTPKDKSKASIKRKFKKIRMRLVLRGEEFLQEFIFYQQNIEPKGFAPMVDMIQDLSAFAVDDLLLVEKNVRTVERMLTEVALMIEKKMDALVMHIFIFSKGIVVLGKFVEAFMHLPVKKVTVYKWIIEKIIKIYSKLVQESNDGFKYVVGSNGLMFLFELLNYCVGMLTSKLKFFPEFTEKILSIGQLALIIMADTFDSDLAMPYYKAQVVDLIIYLLTCGLTTKITELFKVAVTNEGGQLNDLIPKFVDFLAALVHDSYLSIDLIRTLKATDCLGTVSLLYEGIQKTSPTSILPIYAKSVIHLLLSFAKLDVAAFQETLGAEGVALEVRAIASFLMSYCAVNADYDLMLQDVIEMVGYFAVHNLENQSLIQSGQQPTILQQLVSLPFNYFCEPALKCKLFPTLIACSHNNSTNRAIVENECSYKELELFIQTPNIEEKIPLLKIFLAKNITK